MMYRNKEKILLYIIALCCVAVVATVAIVLSVVLNGDSKNEEKKRFLKREYSCGETVTDESQNWLRLSRVELTESITIGNDVYTSENGAFIVFMGSAFFAFENVAYEYLEEYISIIGQLSDGNMFWTDEEETQITDSFTIYGRDGFVLRKDILLKYYMTDGTVNGEVKLVYDAGEEIVNGLKAYCEACKQTDDKVIQFKINGFRAVENALLSAWYYNILVKDITINL